MHSAPPQCDLDPVGVIQLYHLGLHTWPARGAQQELLTTLPTGTPVIVYGEHRAVTRARVLAAELAATGRNARWYAGGLQAWGAAGLPVERASEPGTSQ